MSPPPTTSITDEIIRFALDLCPARCRRFLASFSVMTQHDFTYNWYVASASIWLTMDHVDEFELNCIYSRSEARFLDYDTSIFSKITQDFSVAIL